MSRCYRHWHCCLSLQGDESYYRYYLSPCFRHSHIHTVEHELGMQWRRKACEALSICPFNWQRHRAQRTTNHTLPNFLQKETTSRSSLSVAKKAPQQAIVDSNKCNDYSVEVRISKPWTAPEAPQPAKSFKSPVGTAPQPSRGNA